MGCISARTNLYRSFLKTVPGGEDSEAGAGGGVKVGNNSAGKVGEHYHRLGTRLHFKILIGTWVSPSFSWAVIRPQSERRPLADPADASEPKLVRTSKNDLRRH